MPPEVSNPGGDIAAELDAALTALRNANSQSNTKGAKVKAWVQNYLGADSAVSIINENKQIGNRYKEQKGKLAPYTVLLFLEEEVLERAAKRIGEYLYPGIKGIYFFLYDGVNKLVLAFSGQGHDDFLDLLAGALESDKAEKRTLPKLAENENSEGFKESTAAILRYDDLDLVPPQRPFPPSGLVGMDAVLDQMIASIIAGKHVLLIGPPGVAKTEVSTYVCSLFGAPSKMTTATSEWTTADTIGNYVSTKGEGEDSIDLDFSPGIITETIEKNVWLVIDEFNRAHIDRALGEMFTVLTGQTIDLPFKKKTKDGLRRVSIGYEQNDGTNYLIQMSSSWRIIASMNSFDKASLSRLSLALMRRFSVIHVGVPKPEEYRDLLLGHAAKQGLSGIRADKLRAAAERLVLIYASGASQGLGSQNMEVGPAIPLDSVTYIATRLLIHEDADVETLVWESLINFFFPQLEGRDDAHVAIMGALRSILTEQGELSSRADDRLAVFTGIHR